MTNIEKISVLSLGWGVQSWTMVAMMAFDELQRADYVLHSDTTFERSTTYEFAAKMTPWLGERGVDVVTVKGKWLDVMWQQDSPSIMIPAIVKKPDGSKGQMMRQCTSNWKIAPIRRYIRERLKDHKIKIAPNVVQMMTGITTDEIQRMRDSDVQWSENVYPLIDRGMSRMDCITWLESKDLPVPHKSACTFCPYSNERTWMELKRNGGTDWDMAVQIDANLRNKRKDPAFVHPSGKPLPEAIAIPEDYGASQPSLFDDIEACDSGFCWT